MIWASIDPAKGKMGVAIWYDAKLIECCVIKPMGAKGRFYAGDVVLESRRAALLYSMPSVTTVYIEKGAGGRPNIVDAQGWIRGYIEAVCDGFNTKVVTVNVSEWRRVIKEDQGVSWPKDRCRKKALAVSLVNDLYGVDVTDDEADAILLGRACIRMFNIK